MRVKELVTLLGGRAVHDGVSFAVNRGEIFGILGGSGSGKSTALRVMTMLQRVQRGSVRILDCDLGSVSDERGERLRREWGVLFQSGALFTSLTVGENIAVVLRESTDLSSRLIADIVRLKIRMVGLPDHAAGLYPRELSGGMKKRAGLARALALEPQLLFLDEPTSGLDPAGARAFDALILNLRDMLGLTVVMVTHDPDTIRTALDRMVVLGEGKSLAEGTLTQVLASSHPAVRRFFETIHGRTISHGKDGSDGE